jgi:3-dehydroquinate synthase
VLRCLSEFGFVFDIPELRDRDVLYRGLEEFRQHLGGRLTLTMLRGIGDAIEVHEVDPERMGAAIREVLEFASRGS